jgi:hypothetical protein
MLIERHVPNGIRMVNRRARRAVREPARPHPRGARSLDRDNQLATSVKNPAETFTDWLKRHTTAQDKRRRLYSIHEKLIDSLKIGAHNHDYVRQRAAVEGATGNERGWQTAAAKMDGQKWKPWKDVERVRECQTSWMGFRAACCQSRSVAVPIGCNHRLCPLCNAFRAEHYRSRVRSLFEDIANPQLLTLTVPNCQRLTSETIRVLRTRLRSFLRLHKGFLLGGVYSIEITFNREARTWHPHIHALVDVNDERKKLPYWEFCERKWKLEFDWLCLTQGRITPGKRHWRKGDFEEWVAGVDPRRHGGRYSRLGHRRTVDLRTVTCDKKASYEVLKYITKAAAFVDDHRAVAEFLAAVKGVRAIQTFGSCYGFKIDDPPVEAHLKCECGANKFEKIGLLGMGMVKMSPDGTWYVRDDAPVHGRRCRGSTHNSGGEKWH